MYAFECAHVFKIALQTFSETLHIVPQNVRPAMNGLDAGKSAKPGVLCHDFAEPLHKCMNFVRSVGEYSWRPYDHVERSIGHRFSKIHDLISNIFRLVHAARRFDGARIDVDGDDLGRERREKTSV